MRTKRKIEPTDVLPADELVITVLPRRMLPAGKVTVTVVEQLPPVPEGKVYLVTYTENRVVIHLQVMIPFEPRYLNWLFLGRDEYPVPYTHEPNLEARLRASLPGGSTT